MAISTISLVIRVACFVGMLFRATKHNSLTKSGLVAAAITGIIHASTPSIVNTMMLLAFFASGTKFTKYKLDVKAKLTQRVKSLDSLRGGLTTVDEEPEEPRNHVQVLANSGVASFLCLLLLIWPNDLIQFAIMAQYAAVTADTWSSELGILSKSPPYLITTMQPCPKGTNGGVSLFGLGAATAGGLFIGIVCVLCRPAVIVVDNSIVEQLGIVLLIGACGLMGSIVDSILGAVFQQSLVNTRTGQVLEVEGGYRLSIATTESYKNYSGADILSNNQVNLVMAGISAVNGLILGSLLL